MLPAHIDRNMIPHKPGVYLFKNEGGQVIYVGKAIDLYHRVASYFTKSNGDLKTVALVDELDSVDVIIVESELEALILEANLIKKHLPRFNVRLTDDKDYLYIKITKEDFPKVVTARKHDLKDSLRYFGPFPSSRTVRDTLKALRRVFPWCAASNLQSRFVNSKPNRDWKLRPCFYYHLGLCSGPCARMIDKKEYRKNIFRLAQLLEGKKEKLEKDLIKEMESLAKQEKFEEAGRIRKMLGGVAYLTQSNRSQVYLENPNFMEDQRIAALEDLRKVLSLKCIPHRIEAYDISNILGKEATGSLVVLTEGEIDKSQYRKFRIRIASKPNDVAMMREMIRRRLNHSEWPRPDLMLIDGGKGQVNGVKFEIRSAKWADEIPIYGLAKRREWLYSPNLPVGRQVRLVTKLPRSSPALHLLQKIRDEAHRFALTYHRKLRRNTTLNLS